MTDIELSHYHTWVDNAEAAYVSKYKHEISHNEYIDNIIDTIDENTPLDRLGIMEVEDLLKLELKELKAMLNKWLLDDYFPPMNEAQWNNILKSLKQ